MGERVKSSPHERPKVEKTMRSLLLFAHFTTIVSSLLETRQSIDTSVICGQFDSLVIGPYTLFNDQFGSGGATSGSQCAHANSLDGTSISWVTNWTWTGGNGVKSFSNINLNANIGRQLSEIQTLQVR